MTICRIAGAFAMFVLPTLLASTTGSAAEPKRGDAARPKPKITISKETTYITEPLRDDGMVDYIAALNQQCSKGVTPENNAVVAMLRVLGPKGLDKKVRKEYFRQLGIPELPEKGDYFVPPLEFFHIKTGDDSSMDPADDVYEKLERAGKRPWAIQEAPQIAAMLEQNAKPLDAFVEAAKRPRYFAPLVPTDSKSVISTIQLASCNYRDVVRCLLARAMLRLHTGRWEEAWQDILACHRVGRLATQAPFFVDSLIACTCENKACAVTATLAHGAPLSPQEAADLQSQFRQLPASQSLCNVVDWGERLFQLGWFLEIVRDGHQFETFGLRDDRKKTLARLLNDPHVDWNESLRYANEWQSQIAEAMGKPTFDERKEAIKRLDDRVKGLDKEAEKYFAADAQPPADAATVKARARIAVHCILGGTDWVRPELNCEYNRRACRSVALLSLALARYRAEHQGEYPKTLAELTPKYLAEVPKDPFGDGDLHYKREGDGYVLYSVGINGRDDGGHNYWNDYDSSDNLTSLTAQKTSADDIGVRVGTEKKAKAGR
jgi:hypothetical protein